MKSESIERLSLFGGENIPWRHGSDAEASRGSDGGERGGRSGIYCPLVPVSILDAPPTLRRCVR